jgi:hypothetical protein
VDTLVCGEQTVVEFEDAGFLGVEAPNGLTLGGRIDQVERRD